jgi:hypothetical protein
MKKGSEIRLDKNSVEFKRLVEEFSEKLKDDPFQPGIVHPGLYSDEIAEILEDVLWVRGHSEMTIKIVKEPEGGISVEVLSRKLKEN